MISKLLIFFVSMLCAFLLAEITTRIIDKFIIIYDIEMAKYATSLKIPGRYPDQCHRHKKNSKAHLMGVDVITNSMGLRDKEYSLIKPSKTYRIMVLGDSVTLGWGVEQGDCYPKQLEKMLGKDLSSETGLRYEVINTGVGNYNTVQEVAYLEDDGYKFNPDMIILGFFINDAELVPKKTKSFFLNYSHFAVLFWSKVNLIISGIFPKENYLEYYKNLYSDSNPGWLRCKNALMQLDRYCINNKTKFLVVFIPEFHDLTNSYPFKEVHKKVEDFVKSQSINYLDLYPYFKNQDGRKLWVSYEDAHPNKAGHNIIARGIYEYLIKEGLLK